MESSNGLFTDDSSEMTTINDDEVVFETDVYLSKTLAENLYLFHYPTRCASFVNNDKCMSAKIKPKQQKLELEMALNTESSNYDRSRGEQMAINVDGLNPSGDTFFKSSFMDKYILSGSKAGSSTDNYAVGFLRKGQLHITPLHSILEIRPSFTYMDKVDSQNKKALGNDEEEEEEEAVPVTMRFEGPNAEKDRQMREKSYQYLQQKSASEPWIHINYHPCGSSLSKTESAMLVCPHQYQNATTKIINPNDYLKDLVPECLQHSGYQSLRDEEAAVLTNKPLSDQMKFLMINSHVLKFSKLLEKLPPNIDVVSVERLVQQMAVLVQGCWVVKSELLYNEDYVSPLTGISSKLLINARDYVTWLFTKSRYITRSEVLSAISIPHDDLKNIVSQIAVKCEKGWAFKYPYDSAFVESHPAIEQSQEIKWGLRYKKLVKELSLGMSDSDGDAQKISTPLPKPRQKRHSRSSLSEDGDESGTDMSGNKDCKSKRLQSPKKRTNMSPVKAGGKAKPYQIATLMVDVPPALLESTVPEDVKSDLKNLVGEILRNNFCIKFSDLKDTVAESDLSALVHRSDFDKLLEDALLMCGAQKLKNKWPQNTKPEPLYAFTKFGSRLDRYRNLLLDLFSTTARSRTNFFVKKVEDELHEMISEVDCRQIFEDYCVYKSGFFYLKGTVSLDS